MGKVLPKLAMFVLLERNRDRFAAHADAKEKYTASRDYKANINGFLHLAGHSDNSADEDARPLACGIFCSPR